jgi:DNA polymerase-3 subunit chi
MTNVDFYHLTKSSADVALPVLLSKSLEAGKKAVVSSTPSGLAPLSSALWSHGHVNGGATPGAVNGEQGSWLPHGVVGKDDDDAELCPIWFRGDQSDDPINAEFAFFLDGIALDGVEKFDRVFILFDGQDAAAVDQARRQWKSMKDAGHQLNYWTQDGAGKWQKTK